MYILAIESSSNISVVSIGTEDSILCEYHFAHDMGLLRRLTSEIENLLSSCNLSVSDLNYIAVSLGPGSFTGLRIGIAAAKTLSYTLNIPIIGIPTLKAIARNVVSPLYDIVCPMIFARVDEVYIAAFSGDLKETYIDYTFMTIDEILQNPLFDNKKICFLGTGANKNKDLITAKLKDAYFVDTVNDFPRGASLINLALDKINSGEFDDAFKLTPMYIKKPTPVVRLEKVNSL